MKILITNIFYLSLALLLFSCGEKLKENNALKTVDIESNTDNMQIIYMSQFTDDIRYVPLETNDEAAFSFIYEFFKAGDKIITTDLNSLILYDSNGRFILKFGNKGRGPDEYQFKSNLRISNDNKIYFSSLYDLFEYDINGRFEKKYSNTFLIKENYYISSWSLVEDSLFLGHVPNQTGQIEFKALLVNKYGNIKQSYKNYILFNRVRPKESGVDQESYFYRYNGELFYKDRNNDTLFALDNQYRLVPRYSFNLGKFKEPLSKRGESMLKRGMSNDRMNYMYLNSVYQTVDYLFISCSFGNRFPAKRLTPAQFPIPTINPVLYNTTKALGIYNKTTGELFFCKPTSTDNPLFTSGIYNDIDAGPRFMPEAQVNDSTLVMWVPANQLKDHVASDDFKNGTAKYPEKKRKLEELAESLTEYDNPVLMFVTFK